MLMKLRFFVLILASFASACGSDKDFLKDQDTYEVRSDIGLAGTVTLSFQQVFLYRSISIDESQSSACVRHAADYEAKAEVKLISESLQLSYDQPSKHCARRNTFKQCETYQYIYTFHCRYKAQE